MVSVAMGTVLRRSEMQGLRWEDVDLDNFSLNVACSVVDGHVGICKTETSKKLMPMDRQTAEDLLA